MALFHFCADEHVFPTLSPYFLLFPIISHDYFPHYFPHYFPVFPSISHSIDRREKRNIYIFLFFFPRISTGPIKGPGIFRYFPIFPIISHYFLLFPIISRAISHYFFSAIGIRHRLGYQQIPIPETKEGNIRSLRNQSQTKEDGISVRAVVLILFNERN